MLKKFKLFEPKEKAKKDRHFNTHRIKPHGRWMIGRLTVHGTYCSLHREVMA
jgi:hypothetical protein